MSRSLGSQRGFILLDTIVAIALIAFALVAVTALHGARPPQRRAGALALAGALAEARTLAAADVDATLGVTPLPDHRTQLTVYSSWPMTGAPSLTPDPGFPPLIIPVTVSVSGQARTPAAFAILISRAGYASIAPDYAYDPARPRVLDADPGCNEAAGVTISIADDVSSDAHPFACRGASYDADSLVAPPGSGTSP